MCSEANLESTERSFFFFFTYSKEFVPLLEDLEISQRG